MGRHAFRKRKRRSRNSREPAAHRLGVRRVPAEARLPIIATIRYQGMIACPKYETEMNAQQWMNKDVPMSHAIIPSARRRLHDRYGRGRAAAC